jgi:hypothetical protein
MVTSKFMPLGRDHSAERRDAAEQIEVDLAGRKISMGFYRLAV